MHAGDMYRTCYHQRQDEGAHGKVQEGEGVSTGASHHHHSPETKVLCTAASEGHWEGPDPGKQSSQSSAPQLLVQSHAPVLSTCQRGQARSEEAGVLQ